jgi:hypothetical protein
MGNSALTIGVKVDNGKNGGIVAGSILHGKVYLSNQQASTVHAQSIQLKLIGKEEATIHYTTTENESRGNGERKSINRDGYECFSKTFYSLDHPIKYFPDGVVPRGQYEFPFALQLPKTLLSSMKARKGESKCSIHYEVVAEVYQKPNTLFHKNPHGKENVIVIAIPSVATESSRHLPTEVVRISNCVCCSCFSCTKMGTMALEAKLDRTTLLFDSPSSSQPTTEWRNRNKGSSVYQATDTGHNLIGLRFRCENKSKAKVKAVKVTLTEYIEWSINGRTETVKTILASSEKNANQYSELDALWRTPLPWEEHQRGMETSRLLQSNPWRTIDPSAAVDPAMATDSFRGIAIRVRHVLSLSVQTDQCCMTNPEVDTMVKIYRNPEAFSHVGLSYEPPVHVHHTHPSSAPVEEIPLEEYYDRPQATAPSSVYGGIKRDSATAVPVAEAVAEATVLPEDWNAQTAELVTIPIVEATVLEDTN